MTVPDRTLFGGSIKTKVTLATVVTLSLVLIVISWVMFNSFRTTLRESITKQQYAMVGEIASQMETRIQLAHQQLMIIAADITPHSLANPSHLANILHDANPVQTIFDGGFAIIGNDGRVMAEDMGYPELLNTDLRSRDYVTETLKNGQPQVSQPFWIIPAPHTPMIAFTQPVRNDKDQVICLLVGYHSLNGGQFLTSISAERLGSKAYVYIMAGRTILMHQDSRRIMETVAAGKNRGLDQALGGYDGALDNLNSRGERILSSFRHVTGTNWIVSANIPYAEAFGPLDALVIHAAWIVVIGIAVASLIIWYITRRLTRPIKQLIAHIDTTRDESKPWQPLSLATGDELQRLAEAYDSAMGEVALARQALMEEKDFFSNIIQNAATPMFILDKNHKIIFWNNALAKMTGKSSFQMVGTKQHWQPFYPERRPVMADLIIDHANKAQVNLLYDKNANSTYTSGALRAEGWYEMAGKRLYLMFEAAPITNRQHEIVAAVETLEDITERRLMEESLSRLTRAVEQSPATIVMTDAEGNIDYVNPKFCRTTGYSFEEALGQNPRILKSGDRDALGYAELWNTITTGREWRGEFHNKRKNGTLYWEQASISPLYDKQGKINGYLAIKEDITARKETERELAESRAELEKNHAELELLFKQVAQGKREWEETLDHLPDFVILTDADNRIRRYNKLLSDITGKPINALLGADWCDLLADSGFRFSSFNGKEGELQHEPSGRVYAINVLEITNFEAVVEGQVVSLNDITELRATTAALEKAYSELKNAQMQIFQQEKLASIGQLAAGVAHEINNPMGFINSNLGSLDKYVERISAYLRLIDEECQAGASTISPEIAAARKRLKIDRILDDAHQLIVESQDGAARVRRIVQDLKSFSRVDQAERALVNLNEALETTINIAWNEIKYLATLNKEFGDVPDVLCYPQQLNQVFLNLLVNAAHALGETQGIITVRTWSDPEHAYVSISDTGCGIAEENIQRIFEPFFTTKEVGKGTGLGLSISFDIIKKHGGEINVASEVGAGTTFTVRLPIRLPE